MTIKASTRTAVPVLNMSIGRPIRNADADAIAESMNYRYARSGTRVDGIVFDTPWQTSSTSYVTADSGAGGIDLNTFWPQIVIPRRAATTKITVKAYGQNFLLRWLPLRFTRPNTVSSLAYSSISTTSFSNVWVDGTHTHTTWASVFESGSTANDLANWSLQFEGRAYSGVGDAYIYSIDVFAELLDASGLPVDAP